MTIHNFPVSSVALARECYIMDMNSTNRSLRISGSFRSQVSGMHTLNLYLLTRTVDEFSFSVLEKTLSGRRCQEHFNLHEILSLRALTDAMEEAAGDVRTLLPLLEGFCFSYTIDHISKEFDLIKLAPDGSMVLNIELKSEKIPEERIRHQLEQNRYYLSHISRSILSYSYVAETDTLYVLNDRGYFARVPMEELLRQLERPALSGSISGELEQYFRASDYLISPVADPDRFLRGEYFLTNQQSQFRQEILSLLSYVRGPLPPFLSLMGIAGTGKTLLLLDLGMELSRKRQVLFLHGGPLLDGHRRMDSLLRNVRFISAEDADISELLQGDSLRDYACILCDEANRLKPALIRQLAEASRRLRLPCVLAHDPHRLLRGYPEMEQAELLIDTHATQRFEFSGNIRINRPVYTYLRLMFNRHQSIPQDMDFSCIDVLCAADESEAEIITSLYRDRGYTCLTLPGYRDLTGEGETDILPGAGSLVGSEYDSILIRLDERFYYDAEHHLCAAHTADTSTALLYEALTRTRERLCLLVQDNPSLFSALLELRNER